MKLPWISCSIAVPMLRSKTLPRVVLHELRLPNVDGVEMLIQIRANPETQDLPMAALTPSKEQHDVVDT